MYIIWYTRSIFTASMEKTDYLNSKIIFVNPPYERIAPGYDFVRHITNRSPSLGLLYLAAITRERGYRTSIIESDIENLSVTQVSDRLIREKPNFIGITLFTVGVWQAAEIARRVKSNLPKIQVIVGGPHISSMGMETLQRFPEFDIAVIHEGEQVLPELLLILEEKGSPQSVNGIIYRNNNGLRQTPPALIIDNLDNLPMPAWDLLPDFPDTYLPAIYDYPQGPVATMAASRGCPFLCKFCDTSTFGAKVRANSPQAVFDMMKHLNKTFGIRHIQFVDDLFLASRIRTLELCDLIIDNGLNMTWSCTARVDTVKPDVLKKMKQDYFEGAVDSQIELVNYPDFSIEELYRLDEKDPDYPQLNDKSSPRIRKLLYVFNMLSLIFLSLFQ